MQSIYYKGIEFFIIFIMLPISFAVRYDVRVKAVIGIVGFLYILFVLLKIERKKIKIGPNPNWKLFFRQTLVKLLGIMLATILFVWYTHKEDLFVVLLTKPKLWLFILFFYSVFSVYPQELIYRTFYFQRYQSLFKSNALFIFVNAIVFSLGHLFFGSTLVMVLTFLGGLLFAITYNKTQSTLLVTIEHAIYGCWLFTVGMGSMLGFPV